MEGPRTDRYRTNADRDELERKRGLLARSKMAPLVEYVAALRIVHGADAVPDFDPTEAGVDAPILLLLEAPGPRATLRRGGSGFVSPDNNDASAQNMWTILKEAGIDRSREVVTWTVIPWYLGSDQRIRAAQETDLTASREAIQQLIALLPNLRVVVAIGKAAARGWHKLGIDTSALRTIEAPHPSPQNLNTRRRHAEATPRRTGYIGEVDLEPRVDLQLGVRPHSQSCPTSCVSHPAAAESTRRSRTAIAARQGDRTPSIKRPQPSRRHRPESRCAPC